jgi:hypothetical protein
MEEGSLNILVIYQATGEVSALVVSGKGKSHAHTRQLMYLKVIGMFQRAMAFSGSSNSYATEWHLQIDFP